MPVIEALDRVLEILRTTELYSPQFGAKDDDPHASDLVGGLMSVSRDWPGCRLSVLRGPAHGLPRRALCTSPGLAALCPHHHPSAAFHLGTWVWNKGRRVFQTVC